MSLQSMRIDILESVEHLMWNGKDLDTMSAHELKLALIDQSIRALVLYTSDYKGRRNKSLDLFTGTRL